MPLLIATILHHLSFELVGDEDEGFVSLLLPCWLIPAFVSRAWAVHPSFAQAAWFNIHTMFELATNN
jgi:hypothetical protein